MDIGRIDISAGEVFEVLRKHIKDQGLELAPFGEIRLVTHGKPRVVFSTEQKAVKVAGIEFQIREVLP